MRRAIRGASLGATIAVATALVATESTAQATDPVGIWNFETSNIAMRATGGVRNVLLKVERVDGELRAQMTSPRNRFMDVTDFSYDDGHLVVTFGAYVYDLTLDGDSGNGTMTSPVAEMQLTATRQDGVMYGGDRAEAWVSTRSGILGHRTEGAPPRDEEDPVAWVRSRTESVADLALILRGIPVSFANASDFEAQLNAYAGRRIAVTGEWIGELYSIHSIELAESR